MTDLVQWLDEQIANAEGDRREVHEDFPDSEWLNDVDLAYARERAFREVREHVSTLPAFLAAGECTRDEAGRVHLPAVVEVPNRCPDCGKRPGRWQPEVGGRRDELTLEECRTCGASWTGRIGARG